MGQHSVRVYDYNKNKQVSISTSGDWNNKDTSKEATDLIELIKKYTDKVRSDNAKKQKQEQEEKTAQWEKDVLYLYDTQMSTYANLSDIGLGVWKHYKDENDNPCILRVTNGKIEIVDKAGQRQLDTFTYLDETDLCNIYTLNNLLFVEQGARGTTAINVTVISKDDIKIGKYNMYMFNIENVLEQIKSLHKQQMTVAEFKEKVKNNEI